MPVPQEKLTQEGKAVAAQTDIGIAPTPTGDAGLISRFFELPVPIVLLTLWVAGVALVGSCALTLYHLLGLLVSASGGP